MAADDDTYRGLPDPGRPRGPAPGDVLTVAAVLMAVVGAACVLTGAWLSGTVPGLLTTGAVLLVLALIALAAASITNDR